MRYRISQIKLKPGQHLNLLEKEISRAISPKGEHLKVSNVKIVRESIDARKKPNVKLVYTADFDCDAELNLPKAKEEKYRAPFTNEELGLLTGASQQDSHVKRPIVAGYGPAGIFAGLMLAEWGLRPVIIERGEPVDERIKTVERFWETGKLNPESNVQFGEGGAGTFSDGKLTTGIKDVRIRRVLEEFVSAGADPSILYKQRPHIGTDKLRGIVKNIRKKTERLGGEFLFSTRLEEVITDSSGNLTAIKIHDNKTLEDRVIEADRLILATGHSAADTFGMLLDKDIRMEQKPFSIGVRIEHAQENIDRAQYGRPELAELIGHAEYKLNHRCENGRGVYTFCMCPGGRVINSSSEPETAVTNGMSISERNSGTANSGLLVDVRTEDFESDHPLAGLEFQRKYEKRAYKAAGERGMPVTTYGSFRKDRDDVVRSCLPEFAGDAIVEAMPHLGRKLKGFDNEDSVITGIESRSSSPVRIVRDETGHCSIRGIMPAGEGPGYAGGIMSAAVDGIKTAEKLVSGRLRDLGSGNSL
ncbi:MAG: NAD(FAD)-utilizing dehydrogenase [Firmicutes bacterium]|nr:NAD(FAD)-utilizing dehydrogenase [Bacillota bacterium]